MADKKVLLYFLTIRALPLWVEIGDFRKSGADDEMTVKYLKSTVPGSIMTEKRELPIDG